MRSTLLININQCDGHGNSFGAWLTGFGAKPKLCPARPTKSWDLRNYGFVELSLGFVWLEKRDLWGAARIMSQRQKYFYPTLCGAICQPYALNWNPKSQIQLPFTQLLTEGKMLKSNDGHSLKQAIWRFVKDKAGNSWVNGAHYQVLLCGTRPLTW